MKAIKILFTATAILFACYLLYINTKLFYKPAYTPLNNDVVKQYHYLKSKMDAGAAIDMQQLFPEGYMFMNALYGITAAEIAIAAEGKLKQEAYMEGYKSYVNMDSEAGRSIFPDKLPLPYGAYYRGWTTYQLGKLLAAGDSIRQDEELVVAFKTGCHEIATAIQHSPSPYLESYEGFAWPADMMLCLAALALHDRLFEPVYDSIIAKWVSTVKLRLDIHGMLPHRVHANDGMPAEGARGCSMSLMLCFLRDIDSIFYRQQYSLYKHYFLTYRFGLPGVREYPLGTTGSADADSGPVLLDVGGAASIVGVRVFSAEKDLPVAIGLRNSIEAFGMSVQGSTQKRYLFGALPMADAFIAWAGCTEMKQNDSLVTDKPWRRIFQLYSAATVAVLSLLLLLMWRKK